ncbi:MAG: universal stress protein [Proteobacteria bacterium]|nr:universal stress protein [Pseudomonadota bacterium]
MKILLAVDGSSYTKKMLAYVAAHDEWLGSRHDYTVLHCVTPVPHRAAAFAGAAIVQSYYEDEAETVLRPVREFFAAQGIAATFRHRIGLPGPEIADTAEQGRYDLVMLGSHGHGALVGMILGSAATKVVALCSTPLLLIR